MILLDFSHIMFSNIFVAASKTDINEEFLRHLVFNSLRKHTFNYRNDYGKLVICMDGHSSWRKEYFPPYKHNRKKTRAVSSFDWTALFEIMNRLQQDVIDVYPAKSVYVEEAEADDIIGALTSEHWIVKKILIVSGDKDFVQLQRYSNVSQYAPVQKKWITHHDPIDFLKRHIISGDRSDGIPNILSEDNVLATVGKRQKPLRNAKLDLWAACRPENFCTPEMYRRYRQNEKLIDLRKMPKRVFEECLNKYDEAPVPPLRGLLSYLQNHKMRQLTASIQEFDTSSYPEPSPETQITGILPI